MVEGSIERVDRTGLDFVASKDTIIVHPHKPQWDVFAAFGKLMNSSVGIHMYFLGIWSLHALCCVFVGTLKGGRADWLVEKCTVCQRHPITHFSI